ncbi:hypothetical protein EMCG_05961 [[Emmonsia] crescens]|uniref:Uncharacterized protein n=1 Tax=[Emmonsia] crescens TaxID=73230 RepID=A0A0G2IDL8_9EURO|nr:hypothetical protein EMCG_05961 [Emmonsia crescens UAMH 3008]
MMCGMIAFGTLNNIATIIPRYSEPANFVIAGTSSAGYLATLVSQLATSHMKSTRDLDLGGIWGHSPKSRHRLRCGQTVYTAA